MTTVVQWLTVYQTQIALISGFSFVLLCLTVFATPWLLARLPADYFCRKPTASARSLRSLLISTSRNIVGVIVLLVGLILMVTPGPGLLCIVLGLALCDMPGKSRLLAKLVSSPTVFTALNWARKKANVAPFLQPELH